MNAEALLALSPTWTLWGRLTALASQPSRSRDQLRCSYIPTPGFELCRTQRKRRCHRPRSHGRPPIATREGSLVPGICETCSSGMSSSRTTVSCSDQWWAGSWVESRLGDRAIIQRCQHHKRENVLSYLPKSCQGIVKQKLTVAWGLTSYSEARKSLFKTIEYLEGYGYQPLRSEQSPVKAWRTPSRCTVSKLPPASVGCSRPRTRSRAASLGHAICFAT